LFLQGEFLSPYGQVGRALNQQHSSCFNLPDAALRVQDILTAAAYLATRFATVDVVGVGDAGLWALLARAIAPVRSVASRPTSAASIRPTLRRTWSACRSPIYPGSAASAPRSRSPRPRRC